jgi:hypothetical protein
MNPYSYNREKALAHIRKHGLNEDHIEAWSTKYRYLRSHAKQKGVKCLLTLSQYVKLAIKAGLTDPDQIGKKSHQYNIARKGDTGDYSWSNCQFITHAENMRERIENGGHAIQVEKTSKSFIVWSPSGKKYRGKNLSKFAKEHGLDPGHLSKVCRGELPHHKGWTGKYVKAKS